MPIAIPIIATLLAWPISIAARLGLASLLGFYCGVARSESGIIFALARTSSAKMATFFASAIWAAWVLAFA